MNSKTAFIVSTDQHQKDFLTSLLEQKGVSVLHAETFQDACSLLDKDIFPDYVVLHNAVFYHSTFLFRCRNKFIKEPMLVSSDELEKKLLL